MIYKQNMFQRWRRIHCEKQKADINGGVEDYKEDFEKLFPLQTETDCD
jgi:hypothetical protein